MLLGTAWILSSCDGDTKRFTDAVIASQQGITELQMTPAIRTLNPGDRVQLTNNGLGENVATTDLTATSEWRVADTSVVGVDGNGVVTALANGSTTVTASFAGLSASSSIIVNQADLLSLEFASPTSVDICRPTKFEVVGQYSDNTTRPVTTGVSWFVDGLATASNRFALTRSEATQIEARSNTGLTVSKTFQVNSTLSSIALEPSSLSLTIDDTASDTTATGQYPDGTTDITEAVTWETADSTMSIDSSGTITGLNSGSGTVTVSCGDIMTTLPVTVSVDSAPTALEINNGDSIQANAGADVTLTLDAILSDGSRTDVTADAVWSVDQRDLGLLITIQDDGSDEVTVTATGTGTAFIKASYESKEEVIKITYQ